jgi:hypothetical protein
MMVLLKRCRVADGEALSRKALVDRPPQPDLSWGAILKSKNAITRPWEKANITLVASNTGGRLHLRTNLSLPSAPSPIPHQSFKEVANLYRPKTSRITPRRQQRAIFANGYGRTDEEYWNVEMFIVKVAGARKRGHILQKDE